MKPWNLKLYKQWSFLIIFEICKFCICHWTCQIIGNKSKNKMKARIFNLLPSNLFQKISIFQKLSLDLTKRLACILNHKTELLFRSDWLGGWHRNSPFLRHHFFVGKTLRNHPHLHQRLLRRQPGPAPGHQPPREQVQVLPSTLLGSSSRRFVINVTFDRYACRFWQKNWNLLRSISRLAII